MANSSVPLAWVMFVLFLGSISSDHLNGKREFHVSRKPCTAFGIRHHRRHLGDGCSQVMGIEQRGQATPNTPTNAAAKKNPTA